MVKKFISIIIISTVLCTVLPEQLSDAKIEKGVTIDIARKYYSKDSLKKTVQQYNQNIAVKRRTHTSRITFKLDFTV